MDFGALPPEVNSARMYAGPGAGPMLAAVVAWDHLAANLHSAAAFYHSVVTGLTAGTAMRSYQDSQTRTCMFARVLGPYYAIVCGVGLVQAPTTLPVLEDFQVWPWTPPGVSDHLTQAVR